jgi:hypothetical protein
MELKDLWKLVFSLLTTILLIPVLDIFKVENAIITKPIEKINDTTYKQVFYATKDFNEPVKFSVIVKDISKINILDSSSIYVLAEDEIENKLQTIELVSRPRTKQQGLGGLAKGKYSIEIKFDNSKSLAQEDETFLAIYFDSNPNIGQQPELMRTVNSKWYHFYYFTPVLSLIIFFLVLIAFFLINKRNSHEKSVTSN